MRVATVDIGTNTVLLLVAERGADGELRALEERATITRLGEGVDRTRRLGDAAIARTVACLQQYGEVVRERGASRVAVVGTSALRDAGGSDAVVAAVRANLGADLRVVSGEEEARLTFLGALSGLGVVPCSEQAVFDIGGGSTEVVLGRSGAAPSWVKSFDVGSVRLTERHGEDHAAIARAADGAFTAVPALPAGVVPVGIAGTVTTLAAVSLALVPYDGRRVHGFQMSRTAVEDVVARLAAMDVEARKLVPGMEPKRADVIVAGGIVVLALLRMWQSAALRVSDRGVRWGLAHELAG